MNQTTLKRASSYSNIPRPSGNSTGSSSATSSQSSCKKVVGASAEAIPATFSRQNSSLNAKEPPVHPTRMMMPSFSHRKISHAPTHKALSQSSDRSIFNNTSSSSSSDLMRKLTPPRHSYNQDTCYDDPISLHNQQQPMTAATGSNRSLLSSSSAFKITAKPSTSSSNNTMHHTRTLSNNLSNSPNQKPAAIRNNSSQVLSESYQQSSSMCTTRNLRDILKSCNLASVNAAAAATNSTMQQSLAKTLKNQQQNASSSSSSSSTRISTMPSSLAYSYSQQDASIAASLLSCSTQKQQQPSKQSQYHQQQRHLVNKENNNSNVSNQFDGGRDRRMTSLTDRESMTDRFDCMTNRSSLNLQAPSCSQSKEIEYYQQRERDFLQRIQMLEKENIRVTQLKVKTDKQQQQSLQQSQNDGNTVFSSRIAELQTVSASLERRIEEIGMSVHGENHVNDSEEHPRRAQQFFFEDTASNIEAAIIALQENILREQRQQNELKAQVKYLVNHNESSAGDCYPSSALKVFTLAEQR